MSICCCLCHDGSAADTVKRPEKNTIKTSEAAATQV